MILLHEKDRGQGVRWTRRRLCRECGQRIYLHCHQQETDSDPVYVLFEGLGPPWPKHSCGEYYQGRSDR